MTRTRRTAAALLLAAAGTDGPAQTARPAPKPPAARLLAARPAPDAGVIARGTTPEAGTFARPPQVPTLTDPRRTFAGVPAPDARPQPQPQPPAAPPPGVPPYATGQSGVYAGPPAYRWYGYGSTTPGANPYAPSGQYPRGSANWYAQTGATPGAFPVPVTAGGEQLARFDPPAYAGPPPEASAPLPPPRVEPTLPAEPPTRTVVAPQPITVTPPPVDAGPVVTVPTPMPAAEPPPAPGPAPIATAGLTWQPPAESADTLRFTAAKQAAPAPAPAAVPPPAAMPQPIATSEQPPAFKPSVTPAAPTTFQPAPAPPAPLPQPVAPPTVVPPPAADWKAAPTARGQQPAAQPPSLAAQVRNACYGLATVAEVAHTGPTSLTIKLMAASEADARRAAGEVAKIPALRPYTVKFTAELAAQP